MTDYIVDYIGTVGRKLGTHDYEIAVVPGDDQETTIIKVRDDQDGDVAKGLAALQEYTAFRQRHLGERARAGWRLCAIEPIGQSGERGGGYFYFERDSPGT